MSRKHYLDFERRLGGAGRGEALQHVREGEMTDNELRAHQGTLMLIAGLYQNQKALEKRQNAVERAVEGLAHRLDSIMPAVNQ